MGNVNSLIKPLLKLIAINSQLKIDLANITTIDSAGVAFLVELKSAAKQKNCELQFVNLPESVNKFCQLYQVTI